MSFFCCFLGNTEKQEFVFTVHWKASWFMFLCVWLGRASLGTLLVAPRSFTCPSIRSFRPCSSPATWREPCSSLRIFMPKSKWTGALAKLWRKVVSIWREKPWEGVHSESCLPMRDGSGCSLEWIYFDSVRYLSINPPISLTAFLLLKLAPQ